MISFCRKNEVFKDLDRTIIGLFEFNVVVVVVGGGVGGVGKIIKNVVGAISTYPP